MALDSDDCVLFDMDGLLIDSERLSMRTFEETISDYGLADHTDLFMSLIGANEQALLEALHRSFSDKLNVPEFRQNWHDRYHALVVDGQIPLKPGVRALLDWLQAQGIRMAVATSSNQEIAHVKLANTQILSFFEIVVSGDQVQRSKPDPEIFLKAANAISADHARTTVLEDSFNGVRAGVSAGMSVIQVPDLIQPTEELLALGHRVCPSMAEVLSLFQHEDYQVRS